MLSQRAKDYLERFADELSDDAIGFWQIAKAADDFDLHGIDRSDFASRAILALLSRGAVPVMGVSDRKGGGHWRAAPEFGSTPDEIVATILRDSPYIEAKREKVHIVTWVWFMLPD